MLPLSNYAQLSTIRKTEYNKYIKKEAMLVQNILKIFIQRNLLLLLLHIYITYIAL